MSNVLQFRPGPANPDARTSWFGHLRAYSRPTADCSAIAVFDVADSGCSPFLALADDGKRYWIKHERNPHGIQSLMVERVVAAVGEILEAPVRPIRLISIPNAIAEDAMLKPYGVHAGIGHGSEHIEDAIEKEKLENTGDDGNRIRQPRFLAIWELFAGEDPHWLYSRSEDYQVWSVDHGFWVSGGEMGDWDGDDLARTVNVSASKFDAPIKRMDRQSFLDVADSLDNVNAQQLLSAVATVPVEWGIPDVDLESFAWWIYSRKARTAARLRATSLDATG